MRDLVEWTRALPVVPVRMRRATAVGLVSLEVGLAVGAVVSLVMREAATASIVEFAVATAMLASFAVALGWLVAKGIRRPCMCFGKSTTSIGPVHIIRAVLLAGIAITGLIAARQPLPGLGAVSMSVGVSIILALFLVRLEDVVTAIAWLG
jgi:uncharacterized membrane protein